MLKIITGKQHDEYFCDWLSDRVGGAPLNPSNTTAFGHVEFEETESGPVVKDILAVAGVTEWSSTVSVIAVASNGAKRKKASHEFIWTVLSYVFDICKKTVLLATIKPDNYKSIALAELMGFAKTGTIPAYLGTDGDVLLYCLTKEDWLQGRFSTNDRTKINTPTATRKSIH